MQTSLECLPCFLRQVTEAARMVTDDPAVHERVLRATLQQAVTLSFDQPPPLMGQWIHRLLREKTGHADPYHAAKQRSNALARELLPSLTRVVAEASDPFATAIRLAIAGNVIDFACHSEVSADRIQETVERALTGPIDEREVNALRQAVAAARDILYLADNAGEIFFDRLFIEQFPMDRLTLVVRGGPIINDALMEDVEAAGLASLVEVIDNGSDVPGTWIEACSPAFQHRFNRADMILAKGQGNYETLSHVDAPLFFLLMAKCPIIARDIGCNVGDMVIRRGAAALGRSATSSPP
jgi:damage-control phosphatase, subfamily I